MDSRNLVQPKQLETSSLFELRVTSDSENTSNDHNNVDVKIPNSNDNDNPPSTHRPLNKRTRSFNALSTSPSGENRFRRRSATANEIVETLNATVLEDMDTGVRNINQYTLLRVLGRGSYGTVHLAKDTNLDKNVAIKEFSKSKLQKTLKSNSLPVGRGRGRGRGLSRPGSSRNRLNDAGSSDSPEEQPNNSSTGSLDLLKNEMAIFKKLNHANVIKLYEVLDNPKEDSIYMVFECCELGPIMDMAIDATVDPFEETEARRLFQQIVLGIEYLHATGISHRDIKPDNLLMADDATLKIVDFGVSEMFIKGDDRSGKSVGSPAFFSPELCSAGHGHLSSFAIDIWAMGVTLYCIVVGRLPFAGKSVLDLYHDIKTTTPEYPKDLSPALLDLLNKLLDKNPDSRIKGDDLREHPWVTDRGRHPLPSKNDNCLALVTYVTEEEIENALKRVNNLFTVIKAVSKMKRNSRMSMNSLAALADGEKKQSESQTDILTNSSIVASPTPGKDEALTVKYENV